MTTVIVSSVIANKPLNGGNAWMVLNWVHGLQRLGCKVHFVEQLSPQSCVDGDNRPARFDDSISLQFFRQVTSQFGLGDSSTCIYDQGPSTFGLSITELRDLAESTDLLVNITGHLTLQELKSRVRKRAYVDLDPGYTQFWQASGNNGARLEGHDLYFTVGENVGTPDCPIPAGGLDWKAIRPPVVLDDWPVVSSPSDDRFTTIASWRGAYGRVQWGNRLFGQKAHEFRRFIALPRRTRRHFEIALDIHPADERDRRELSDHGWRLVDPRRVAADPASFRRYIQSSSAEFSAAQGIYVENGSGWFSDRTVCYLASGKPALVQNSGFNRDYAAAGGLVPFCTLEQAVAGAEEIFRDYSQHCRAARTIAEKYFDSDRVLAGLLEHAGLGA